MATNTNSRLQRLSHSDFEIADGQPNIKGWDVKDAQGSYIGEVDELIFDKESLKVRYIVVDLDDNELDLDDRDVLIPIGMAELNDKSDDIILPNVTAAQLAALPEYEEDDFSEEAEHSIRNVFSGAAGATAATGAAALFGAGSNRDEFYAHEHFNDINLYQRRGQGAQGETTIPVIEEQLQVGKKVVETGGVRLRTRIVETPVEEEVRLKEEHVRVEREAVNRPATAADFKEGVVEVREEAEVPVVAKEARVVEEVTLNKEVKEHEHTINETLRSTEVDVEKLDKDNVQTRRDA